ncbi:hypothetical protein AA0117_g12831 [Alternaria alternata]|uniref:ABM domain-containing protein n=1 Tax=Alternaria alternata TaxID=5599 RepID=A0A4V1WPT5_ALTAL|nr:hypothetical protein AA0117_g12831 [Alternaria alternata]
MSERTVELASIPIRPDIDLTASRNEARAAWDSAMDTVAKQPGVLSLYWGLQIEHPNTMQMIVEWDAVASQTAFTAGPEYLPFVNSLKDVLCGPPSLSNIFLPAASTSDDDPFVQPVTEIMKAYFPPSSASSTVSSNTHFSQFQAAVGKIPHLAVKGIVGGWSLVMENGSSSEDIKGQPFAAFIGWPNVEAHEASLKREEFEKAVKDLRMGISGAESVHAALKRVK